MIQWRNEFSTGFDGIDEQHMKLVEIINDLSSAIKTKDDELGTIMELMSELDSYVAEHFRYEESLMEKYDYQDKEWHIKQHINFTNKLDEVNIFSIEESKRVEFLNDLLEYTVDWLIRHTIEIDKKLGAFLSKQTANV